MAREDADNRIRISAWILRHYGEIIGNAYPFWFVDRLGNWAQIGEDHSLEEAFEIARDQLDRERVVYLRIWPPHWLKIEN
jgi:hypothetical protein